MLEIFQFFILVGLSLYYIATHLLFLGFLLIRLKLKILKTLNGFLDLLVFKIDLLFELHLSLLPLLECKESFVFTQLVFAALPHHGFPFFVFLHLANSLLFHGLGLDYFKTLHLMTLLHPGVILEESHHFVE